MTEASPQTQMMGSLVIPCWTSLGSWATRESECLLLVPCLQFSSVLCPMHSEEWCVKWKLTVRLVDQERSHICDCSALHSFCFPHSGLVGCRWYRKVSVLGWDTDPHVLKGGNMGLSWQSSCLRLCLQTQEVWGWFLVRELRFPIPRCQKTKTEAVLWQMQ